MMTARCNIKALKSNLQVDSASAHHAVVGGSESEWL